MLNFHELALKPLESIVSCEQSFKDLLSFDELVLTQSCLKLRTINKLSCLARSNKIVIVYFCLMRAFHSALVFTVRSCRRHRAFGDFDSDSFSGLQMFPGVQ
jgi:hypothetical protein